MNVLLDTDILIDVALDRKPFSDFSSHILDAAESKVFKSFIAWHSIANFYYIVSSENGSNDPVEYITELLQFVEVSKTSIKDALFAAGLNLKDFEDALQVAAARACHAAYIITRNVKHYYKSPITAVTPKIFLKTINYSSVI